MVVFLQAVLQKNEDSFIDIMEPSLEREGFLAILDTKLCQIPNFLNEEYLPGDDL